MRNIHFFLHSSDIKIIVFDLHGTITNRTSIHPYHIDYRNLYIEKKMGYAVPKNLLMSTDETFEMFPMLDKYAFYKYRDSDLLFDFGKIHFSIPKLKATLNSLSNSFSLVLQSDSYRKQIDRTLDAIDLNGIFGKIISKDEKQRKVLARTDLYGMLCDHYQVNMCNILMVGDRIDKDINPALYAGANAIRVKSSHFILEALELITKMLSTGKVDSIKTGTYFEIYEQNTQPGILL